ncbi:galactose-1-phosphate uridylyltransferase [Actinophytocola xinjiangensis]|uniref:Galactose-1-phosphate uridylyltransferase n=1 Tax=Actinophytocola xinjiangensis TaxID=485602 RepID=A0A7Z0WFP4_9PSEU|nr:galactose-1-phosphate uridylyltransferase [Actinophytocola xinjiangensis]
MGRRTTATLADGREILYFDLPGAPDRVLTDPRELDPVSTASQLRHDPALDEWVVLASHRQNRTFLPPADECPLCPSRDGRHTEVPSPDYDVVVFENRFPSLSTHADPVEAVLPELVASAPGIGRCEVVCFTSDHNAAFATLSPTHARLVVEAWADRTTELSALPGVAQVFCFENRGAAIGVTLAHPHGQIYAYPFVTPRTRQMLASAAAHAERTGTNLFADLLAGERKAGTRVVAANEHWTAFVPAAARWPVEVHLYPHRRVPAIPALSDAERDAFTLLYLDVLRRFDALHDRPLPYIAAWHQAPAGPGAEHAYLHLQLSSIQRSADKLKYLAGSESGMGVFITDVLPEDVARRLRSV